MGHANPHVPLRKNHPVHPQFFQGPAVQYRNCFGYDRFDAKILQKNRAQYTHLNVVANGDDPAVKVAYAEGFQHFLIGGVGNHGMRQQMAPFFDDVFIPVYAQYLVPEFHQLQRQTGAEASQSDHDKLLCLHLFFPLIR
ncbi:hypothetical protein D1872_280880 [compost metagenome]